MTARYHIGKAFALAGVDFRSFHTDRKYAGARLIRQIKDFIEWLLT
jgi:integrase/recombinase XerC